MYPPIHDRPSDPLSFERLNMLWEKYPQYRSMEPFSTLDALLEGHPSWQTDFEEFRDEYTTGNYEQFLIRLSLADLPYRKATQELIRQSALPASNPYAEAFMEQFASLDTDRQAFFLFPESYVSQFFVIAEVCKRAEAFYPIRNLFPDEEKTHYLAVFDKQHMDDVLLMFHLLYTNTSQDLFGGYSLYDYPFLWYQTHLRENGVVLRSPYLPDRLARYQGALPFCYNPVKTVCVRRNIEHILDKGYFSSELEFFLCLTTVIMPLFQWWYRDLALYEEKNGITSNWKLERTRIRTRLTADGIIKPKWKHELSLFHAIKKKYPDTLYQYRPEWLGRQSLDLYIPSLHTAIEYQGIQHFLPIEFFGGQDALTKRQKLDRQKKDLCRSNQVRLIEWPYSFEPTASNIQEMLRLRSCHC